MLTTTIVSVRHFELLNVNHSFSGYPEKHIDDTSRYKITLKYCIDKLGFKDEL